MSLFKSYDEHFNVGIKTSGLNEHSKTLSKVLAKLVSVEWAFRHELKQV